MRIVSAILVLAALTLLGPAPQDAAEGTPRHDSAGATLIHGEDASARLSPEVRLRKLHLVRPDLIPYPIYFEVHC